MHHSNRLLNALSLDGIFLLFSVITRSIFSHCLFQTLLCGQNMFNCSLSRKSKSFFENLIIQHASRSFKGLDPQQSPFMCNVISEKKKTLYTPMKRTTLYLSNVISEFLLCTLLYNNSLKTKNELKKTSILQYRLVTKWLPGFKNEMNCTLLFRNQNQQKAMLNQQKCVRVTLIKSKNK